MNDDTPEICAARAADPAWQAEQKAKRDATTARFIQRREDVGMPIVPKRAGERF